LLYFRVDHEASVFAPRRAARDLATTLGFDRRAAIELAIAVSELGSNIVKYGVRGSITVEATTDPQRGAALQIIAADEGPPFCDFATALRDGCDDRGPLDPVSFMNRHGIGAGLGAVKRFTDSITLEPAPEGAEGKRIIVVRYLKRSTDHHR
jgi:anti-sigma regulatory factor (Ser/Thr protein kinase)